MKIECLDDNPISEYELTNIYSNLSLSVSPQDEKTLKQNSIEAINNAVSYNKKHISDFITEGFKDQLAKLSLGLPEAEAEACFSKLPQILADEIKNKAKKISKEDSLKAIEDYFSQESDTENLHVQTVVNSLKPLRGLMSAEALNSFIDENVQNDKILAKQISAKLLTFNKLVELSDLNLQKLIRKINIEELKYALKTVDEEVLNKFLKNLSKNSQHVINNWIEKAIVHEDLAISIQNKLLLIAEEMVTNGEIFFPVNFPDDFSDDFISL